MAEHKVPAFLSKKLHSLGTKEEKKKLLEQFVIWKQDVITNEYILFLENQLQELTKEDEDKTEWLSVFHWKYKSAHTKGKRSVLRKLLTIFK